MCVTIYKKLSNDTFYEQGYWNKDPNVNFWDKVWYILHPNILWCNIVTENRTLDGKSFRATSHMSQELWPWNYESPRESVQRPSQDTSKIM